MSAPGYGQQTRSLGSGPVTDIERRLIAYRWCACLTETSWHPKAVFHEVSPSWILSFLEEAGDDRDDFEVRAACLEEQMVNYGLHPMHRNHGIKKDRPRSVDYDEVGLPSTEDLVKAAEIIYSFVTDQLDY